MKPIFETKHKMPSDGLVVVGKRVYTESPNSQMTTRKREKVQYITVVSCGKIKSTKPICAAEEAYVGRAFTLKKQFAQISGFPWFIFSAKYGIIKPFKNIDPDYDETIKSKKDIMRASEKISKQLPGYPEFSNSNKILFLGPQTYAEALRHALSFSQKSKLIHIAKGLKQGESQKVIKDLITGIKTEKINNLQLIQE